MWDCPNGDANNIAHSLEVCPVCGAPKPTPDAVTELTAVEPSLAAVAPSPPDTEGEQDSGESVT